MSIESIVIILMWGIGLVSFLFIPKNRMRRFILAHLFCQSLTWLSSLFHVQFDLLTFPFREFPNATDLLVTTEYFFYPTFCAFYIIFEPKGNYLFRLIYLSFWITVVTMIDLLVERYTNLIEYVHYSWYWTWMNFFILFALTNILYQWFFKDKALFREDEGVTR
jgi:hypothetical protein